MTTLANALEIGQQWEALSPRADVLLPMVYPSHYPRGAFNLPRPNAEPYKVVFAAINRARKHPRRARRVKRARKASGLRAFSALPVRFD